LAVCSLDGFVTPKRGGIAAERDAGNVVGQLEELAVRRITCREATCFCPSLFSFFFLWKLVKGLQRFSFFIEFFSQRSASTWSWELPLTEMLIRLRPDGREAECIIFFGVDALKTSVVASS